MTTTIRNILLISLTVIFMFSCKDDPTSIGEQLIPEEDKISIFSVNSLDGEFNQRSKTFKDEDELSFADRILLGMHNQTKYTSLAKFSIPISDSIRRAVDSSKLVVNKTWIEFPIVYRLGQLAASYNFSIHEITSSWTAIGFDADSLALLEYESENLASNINEVPDSLLTLDFDNDIILRWIEDIVDGDLINIPGVIFIPDASSDKVLGFSAISTSAPDDMPTIYSIIESPGDFIDTISARAYSDVYVPEGPDIDEKEERMYVQGALIYRSNLLFGLTDLPENITINNSVLRLYIDETESIFGTNGVDSLLVYSIEDSSTMALDTLSRTRLYRTDNYYEGALTAITQVLLQREENHGIHLRLEKELETGNRVAMYNSKASDKALRPHLTIIYTIKN